ncbi:Aromatic prenyltransferase, DMATS type [Penicillium expansum]|nr:Aromatic prenyltransferase, DMATS type [Penicillium expansum]
MALVLWNALFSPFTKLWYSDDTQPEIEEPSGQPYESDAELWNNEVGKMLNMMLELAGYPENSRTVHSEFFRGSVAPSLGHHPRGTGDPLHWKSFMTDDHTPVELSWCWSTALDTPTVRYSVEPIGKWAGQPVDPINTLASLRLLGDALQLSPEMDLYLHRHFQKSLMSLKSSNEDPITQNPQSQSFMAFDLLEKTIVVKQYYLPTWRALAEKKTNFAVVEEAILNVPALGNSLLSSFSVFTNYLESFPEETRPAVEIMAIDCLDPLNSRIKVYVRSRSTTLKSVFDTLTIGGKAPKSSDEEESLRELWHSVFGLNQDQSDETPLSQNDHRTGGILYYFEFKSGTPIPKTKVYLPVRHYAQNDDQIARGLSGFLDRRGKKLAAGSYLEGVQTLW